MWFSTQRTPNIITIDTVPKGKCIIETFYFGTYGEVRYDLKSSFFKVGPPIFLE